MSNRQLILEAEEKKSGKVLLSRGEIPIRLEIAARLLAGDMSRKPLDKYPCPDRAAYDYNLKYYLEIADSLIETHNKTCKEEG